MVRTGNREKRGRAQTGANALSNETTALVYRLESEQDIRLANEHLRFLRLIQLVSNWNANWLCYLFQTVIPQ